MFGYDANDFFEKPYDILCFGVTIDAAKFTLLQSLEIEGAKYIVDAAEALKGNSKLQQLAIFCYDKPDLDSGPAKVIAHMLNMLSTLTGLYLPNNKLGPEGANFLAAALIKHTTLRKLDLSGNGLCSTFHDDIQGAQCIADVLKGKSTLECLDLSDNNLGSKAAEVLAAALEMNCMLECLSLRQNVMGADGARFIAAAFKKNGVLNWLDFSRNMIGNVGAISIADMLAMNDALEHLSLTLNMIGADGVISIAGALKINSRLRELNLSKNDLFSNIQGAQSIADALKLNSTLKCLRLEDTKLDKQGAELIAAALKVNRTLTILDLTDNVFFLSGAKAFLNALKVNFTLRRLYCTCYYKCPHMRHETAHEIEASLEQNELLPMCFESAMMIFAIRRVPIELVIPIILLTSPGLMRQCRYNIQAEERLTHLVTTQITKYAKVLTHQGMFSAKERQPQSATNAAVQYGILENSGRTLSLILD